MRQDQISWPEWTKNKKKKNAKICSHTNFWMEGRLVRMLMRNVFHVFFFFSLSQRCCCIHSIGKNRSFHRNGSCTLHDCCNLFNVRLNCMCTFRFCRIVWCIGHAQRNFKTLSLNFECSSNSWALVNQRQEEINGQWRVAKCLNAEEIRNLLYYSVQMLYFSSNNGLGVAHNRMPLPNVVVYVLKL